MTDFQFLARGIALAGCGIGAGCALIMRFVMPDNMMLGGMGLLLVILMLSRCGVEAHTGGKCA